MSRDCLVHKAVEADKILRKFQPTAEEVFSDYIVQPKYDGVNCVALVIGIPGVDLRVELLTRTGNVIASCQHIKEALLKFPGIKPGAYLGELWTPGVPFATISGNARRFEQSPDLQFVIFDYLTDDEWHNGESSVGYSERVARLPYGMAQIAPEQNPVWLAECEGTLQECGLTALEAAQQYVEHGGYDGIILRKRHGKWIRGSGRTGEIIKVKPTLSYTVPVTGYVPGEGKYAGQIGSLLVTFRGKEQGAGTGLKDSERSVANFESNWLGKYVEVEAMGLTVDGLLREPRLKGLRQDPVETHE